MVFVLVAYREGEGGWGGGRVRGEKTLAQLLIQNIFQGIYFPCSYDLMPYQSGANGFYTESYFKSYLYI